MKGVAAMKLSLNIDENITEPNITIEAPTLTNNIKTIIQCIEDIDQIEQLRGYHDDSISFIKVDDILSIKTEHKQVVALTQHTQYVIKSRLYTLEDVLPSHFIRISKSEIININKLHKLSIEPNGLIKMYLQNAYETYSARRYLKSIKERLEL